ncbi:MAG TPA: PD-(D/E)XK nuclease family protein [Acidimicrobiales bacterium]|nr:PD-(D/E)XK nuclease family protein [Acidimicrobiales bacterium]
MSALALTAEQQAVVDHRGGGLLRVVGRPGTGKTTALVARYLGLVAEVPASAAVVLCATRAAAGRFLDAVLPRLGRGFDSLPVTTPWGLAHDLLTGAGHTPVLLTAAEQREEVGRLLAADGPGRWPSCAHLLGRPAFADEVAAAVSEVQACFVPDGEILARAERAGPAERARWADLLGFAARYRGALAARNLLDASGLLAAAVRLLERPDQAGAATDARRFAHVLVDDAAAAPPAAARLVAALAASGAGVTLATEDEEVDESGRWSPGCDDVPGGAGSTSIRLSCPFRASAAPALVSCAHPAVEPEAVAGELLAAREAGVPWALMGVLLRHPARARGRAVVRALARHGVPTAAADADAASADEPVVRAVLDVLRWVAGDTGALDRLVASPVAGLDAAEVRAVRREAAAAGIPLEAHPRLAHLADLRHDLVARAATEPPSALAFEVWRRGLSHLVDADGTGDDRALDALVAFLDGLARRAERRPHERLAGFLAAHADRPVMPDPWRSATSLASADAVTVASIAAARGREWHTVVVAGCVEGELPAVRSRPRLFDPALLEDGDVPPPADRRRQALADERALFGLACSRATHRLVGTAAPEPGVLLSRFVEAWPPAAVRLPLAPGPLLPARAATAGAAPAFPDGQLRLSASQLATYDDCPLRYAYEYVLGARRDAGVHARLGSLVHQVLAAFLDPAADDGAPRTRERLVALAEERWRDDIARFRPQVEEARRDYFAMLDAWWTAEGDSPTPPDVVAVERRFEVDVGPHRLTGFIDRIDRVARVDAPGDGDGGGPGLRIVDYKTGKAEPTADAVADDLQLAVYHLAASRDPELAALGPPAQLRLLYVRSMHALDQPVRPDHEAATEARVVATADRILAEEFEPSVEANCRLCSFQRVCPLQPEGRTTGAGAP